MDSIRFNNYFKVRILRGDEIIFEDKFSNGVTIVGKNELLDTMFRAATQSTWYCGLIGAGTILSEDDTMSSHVSWTEFTDYTESVRQTWVTDAAVAASIQNPATAYIEFTVNVAGEAQIPGIFITSSNTKGGTSGVLWSTGFFNIAPTPASGDVVQVQYIVNVN